MQKFLFIITSLNIVFLILHEMDAVRHGEWKMFKLNKKIPEEIQYQLFLWLHFPLLLLIIFYAYSVFSFEYLVIWLIMNIFSVIHLILHIIFFKSRKNVFKNKSSFVLIVGIALTGLINLMVMKYY
ncbi:MAG: hypothetical protein JEZ06_23615 [Anaerolineaceae bacterium]|nr:hypothetical protein [Anaerolineaceae bacterium]